MNRDGNVNEYDREWFSARAERAAADAEMMAPDIVAALGKSPESVIDIGCGDGALLRSFGRLGAKQRIGVDANGPDDWASDGSGLHLRLDLSGPIDLAQRAELVACLEVAEHLPAEAAPQLVANCVAHGDRVLFSAAPPGQGGTGHINEQPIEYWDALFAGHGYERQDLFRHRMCSDVSWWYRANTYLYAHRDALVTVPSTAITMARYRDNFAEVQDAVAALEADSFHKFPGMPRHILRDVYRSQPLAFHELAYSAVVDKMRSMLASEHVTSPLFRGVEYLLWIDADQSFRPQQAIDLIVAAAANDLPVLTGLYVTKQERGRIVHQAPQGASTVPIGPYAGKYPVPGIGFGFVVVHRSAFERMATGTRTERRWLPWPHVCKDVKVPIVDRCWSADGAFGWSFFYHNGPRVPDLRPGRERIDPVTGCATDGLWNEDYEFCNNLRNLGIEAHVHGQIAVGHIGRKVYTMRDLA